MDMSINLLNGKKQTFKPNYQADSQFSRQVLTIFQIKHQSTQSYGMVSYVRSHCFS